MNRWKTAFPILYLLVLFPVSMHWILEPTALLLQCLLTAVWFAIVILGANWNALQASTTARTQTPWKARFDLFIGLVFGVALLATSICLLREG